MKKLAYKKSKTVPEPPAMESGNRAVDKILPMYVYNAVDVAHIAALLMGQKPGISTKDAADWAMDLLKQSAAVLENRPKRSGWVSFEDGICEITGTSRNRVGRAEEYFKKLLLYRPSEIPGLEFSEGRKIRFDGKERAIWQLRAYPSNEDVEVLIEKRRERGFTKAEGADLKRVYIEARIKRARRQKKDA